MTRRRALSFIEVFLGILLLGLVLGPVLAAFSTLRRGTTASIYEVPASHYATELLEQIRVLPIPSLLEAAQAVSLAGIIGSLEIPTGDKPINKIKLVDNVYLFYSQLPAEIFRTRRLEFQRVVKSSGNLEINLLRVTAQVTWQPPGRTEPKTYSAVTWIMEP